MRAKEKFSRTKCKNEAEWLKSRKSGFGASDAAAVVGMSAFKTNIDVWRNKVGLEEPGAVQNSAAMQRGHDIEGSVRRIFEILNPGYRVAYHQFDILRSRQFPFMTATLDGELTEIATGRKGVLEIKSAAISNRASFKEWDKNNIPQMYYIQLLHQLLVTGWDYSILYAILIFEDGTGRLNKYSVERADVIDELRWVLEKEKTQWRYVEQALEHPDAKELYSPGLILRI